MLIRVSTIQYLLLIALKYKHILLKTLMLRYSGLLFCFFTIVFFSCKKELSTLGLDLQPGSDKINGFSLDTVTLKAFTKREDSLSTDERTFALLGSYTDPVFGRTDASFLTQIRLSTSNVTFGTAPVADSIVLYLDYSSYYGDTNTVQNVSVYELENDVYIDSAYYSDLNISNYTPNNLFLANQNYTPKPNADSIAIKLNLSLAQKFVDVANTSNFLDNTAFVNWFKGIYVKTQSITSGGAIIYFDLLSARSKITLYYHNDTVQNKFDFLINSSCARVNLFNHDYTTSTINSIGDSLTTDSLIYLQAMSGLMSKIKTPYLPSLKKDSTIAIVRAELIIPVDNYDATFKPPTKLLLVCYNSTGSYEFLPDYFLGSSYFDGTFHSGDNTYRFNISRYVQQLMDKTRTDYGLALFVSDNRVSANRVVIRGPKCKNKGTRLSITYLKP